MNFPSRDAHAVHFAPTFSALKGQAPVFASAASRRVPCRSSFVTRAQDGAHCCPRTAEKKSTLESSRVPAPDRITKRVHVDRGHPVRARGRPGRTLWAFNGNLTRPTSSSNASRRLAAARHGRRRLRRRRVIGRRRGEVGQISFCPPMLVATRSLDPFPPGRVIAMATSRSVSALLHGSASELLNTRPRRCRTFASIRCALDGRKAPCYFQGPKR